jgi:hypothetical protein
VPSDLVFPHYVGESLNLYHHPDHKRYFVSGQQRDEVWMFKCFDSKKGVAAGETRFFAGAVAYGDTNANCFIGICSCPPLLLLHSAG